MLLKYQGRGIGSALVRLAREHAPTLLFFMLPGAEAFYEKNGCERSLQSHMIPKAETVNKRAGAKEMPSPARPQSLDEIAPMGTSASGTVTVPSSFW